jgi:hypothetical protein
MKLVITESQLSNLVVDIHEDSGDNISRRNGYILHGGWKEENRHEHVYKKMKSIYTALRKGSGEITIFSKDIYPPIIASYVLPHINDAEFLIGYPRGSWDTRPTDNADGSSMSININKKETNWTIHNIEDYANARQGRGYTEEEFVQWKGNDMVKYLIAPRFAKFGINLF